jgi:hypothetical protein
LAQCNYIDALTVYLYLQVIHEVVMVQHLARNLAVAFAQSIHCPFESLLRLSTKQQNTVPQ